MSKKLTFLFLAIFSLSGVCAQQSQTSNKTSASFEVDGASHEAAFLFGSNSDAFLFPHWGNENIYGQVSAFIAKHRESIDNGNMPIIVNGYCGKGGSDSFRRTKVRQMSNRVKSELIHDKIAVEANFRTTNSIEPYSEKWSNVVVVRFVIPSTLQPSTAPATEAVEAAPAAAAPVASAPTDVADQPTAVEFEAHLVTATDVVEDKKMCDVGIKKGNQRWYLGVEGGLPFAFSNLTSFTQKKAYAGWQVGLYAGYRFSPLFSLEIGGSIGKNRQGASKCCDDLWFGTDGKSHASPVAGMGGDYYRNIYSILSVQQYAVRANFDLLQIAKPSFDKRWSLNLTPAIYAVSVKSVIKQERTDVRLLAGHTSVNFGAGVGLGLGYRLTNNLGIGLHSGIVCVFGDQFDNLVSEHHNRNMFWNNRVSLDWRFGCKK